MILACDICAKHQGRGPLRGELGALGERMIPTAVRELNERLKTIQRHMYAGDYHEIPSSLRSSTRPASGWS